MADIATSGALSGYQDPNDPNKKQPGAVQQLGQPVNLTGAQSDTLNASAPGSAPSGAGGAGGWTNIQSYLGANQGDTGSANYINKQVGDQFGKEQTDLYKAGADTVKQGMDQATHMKDEYSGVGKALDAGTQAYSWDGNQSDPYSGVVNQYKTDLNTAYSGPSSFSYGISQPTQQYATNLGDDKSFGNMLNDSYSQRAGQPMNNGQLNLQRQLDTTNDPLQQTRQNLLGQYSGLKTKVDDAVTKNNTALNNAATDYRTDQGHLRDYLSGAGSDLKTKISGDQGNKYQEYQNAAADEEKRRVDMNRIENSERPLGPGQIIRTGGPAPDSAQMAAARAAYAAAGANTHNVLNSGTDMGAPDKARFNFINEILGSGTPYKQHYNAATNTDYADGGPKKVLR